MLGVVCTEFLATVLKPFRVPLASPKPSPRWHKLTILTHIGDIEAERSALSDRGVARKGKEVARTAQFEVLLGDLKAVVGVAHRLQSLLCGVAKATLCSADQNDVQLLQRL